MEVGVSMTLKTLLDLQRAVIQKSLHCVWSKIGELGDTVKVLPGGRPGRALSEKTPVAAAGGGRLIMAGLSSGRTCSTGVWAWASTVES